MRGADHLGRTLQPRMRDALRFLDQHVLHPPPPETSFAANKARTDKLRRSMGVPDDELQPPFPATSPPKSSRDVQSWRLA